MSVPKRLLKLAMFTMVEIDSVLAMLAVLKVLAMLAMLAVFKVLEVNLVITVLIMLVVLKEPTVSVVATPKALGCCGVGELGLNLLSSVILSCCPRHT